MKELINRWFKKWEEGDFHNLPISDDFLHQSPFGLINGKEAYINLVEKNKDKFLGHTFEIHDGLYENERACIRYTSTQGGFSLDVSEWHYAKDGLIEKVVAYYHIGEIRNERSLGKF